MSDISKWGAHLVENYRRLADERADGIDGLRAQAAANDDTALLELLDFIAGSTPEALEQAVTLNHALVSNYRDLVMGHPKGKAKAIAELRKTMKDLSLIHI